MLLLYIGMAHALRGHLSSLSPAWSVRAWRHKVLALYTGVDSTAAIVLGFWAKPSFAQGLLLDLC